MTAQLPIYLASKSPRRQNLLIQLGIRHRTIIPYISEKLNETNPQLYAMKIAQRKVKAVAGKIKRGIIIGVDTVVIMNGKIIGKPKNREEAYKIISVLSGRKHQVISGLYMLRKPDNRFFRSVDKTIVRFRKLNKGEILNYVKTNEPYDKAGGYGIQGQAGKFIDSINGCYYNVVGLPIGILLLGFKRLC